MNSEIDVVTFGESMGLLQPTGQKGLEMTSSLEVSFGGAESNVAIGLSRLGHKVGWCGRLGQDPFGRRIYHALRGEGVDVSRVTFSGDAPTGIMQRESVRGQHCVYYNRRGSAGSELAPEHLDEAYISRAKILHITGITPALSQSCRRAVIHAAKLARSKGIKVCFDPNLRLKLWTAEEAREVLLPLAALADYFLPGMDELTLLYGNRPSSELLKELANLEAVSIVKGGPSETLLVQKEEVTAVPCYPVQTVVDTVGAGDGFCAGFLSGLLQDLPLSEAVRRGNLIGSLVIQMPGDWEGLPTREEAEAVETGRQHVER